MLWLSRRPEWQRSREFETTTRTSTPGSSLTDAGSFGDEDLEGAADSGLWDEEQEQESSEGSGGVPGRPKMRVVFQPTFDSTHTIFYRGHWLRVRRSRKTDGSGCEVLSISSVLLRFLHFTQCA
jgi:mitochondrial chaperone BCS1